MKVSTPPLADDLYRRLLHEPPAQDDAAAHLTWLRLISRAIGALDTVAPHSATLLCSTELGVQWLTDFGRSGAFEDAIAHGRDLDEALVSWMDDEETVPQWMLDVVCTEAWLAKRRGEVELSDAWRKTACVRTSSDREFIIVSHDPLLTLQALVGWRETTVSRVGNLLWLLGMPPVRPLVDPTAESGIVVFEGNGADAGSMFVAVEDK